MRISDWSSDVCSSDLWRPWGRRNLIWPGGSISTTFSAAGSACSAWKACLRAKRALQFGKRRSGVRRKTSIRSEEHTSELQSLMRISYAVFCLKKKIETTNETQTTNNQQ